MQNLSDTGLMLTLFLFLAIFYICVALLYVKLKSKAATNPPRNVQTRYAFSQAEYSIPHDNFHRTTRGEGDKIAMQVTQIPQPTRADPKLEPSLPQTIKSDGELSFKGSTDETREIVEATKSSVKDTETDKDVEKADTVTSEQIKTSDDWGGLEYHIISEDFVKSLKDLKDAVDELRKRINI
jgi:hypothetical protein